MKTKILSILVMTLLIATTAVPALGMSGQLFGHVEKNRVATVDVTLDECVTTDWINGWQDHGLTIKEWPIDGEVYAYVEVSADDLTGVNLTHRWWYDSGTGLQNTWEWWWVIPEPWTSAWSYTYWQIGLDYGKGWGYIEVLADGVSIGTSNNYAMDNTKPNTPTITGSAEGKTGEPTEYNFVGTDPDGFDIYYCIDWGDGSGAICLGPFPSGEGITESHTWAEDGEYTIRCSIMDLVDSESGEATLQITMPKSKPATNHILFQFLERLAERFPLLTRFLNF